jgi:hypothetical protein
MKGLGHLLAISIFAGSLAATPALADDIDNVLNRPLKADEGILVIAVDSEFAFKALRIKRDSQLIGDIYAEGAPAGKSLYMAVVPKGHYEWKELLLGENNFQRGIVTLGGSKRHYDFDVKAGKVNYPGDFVISTNQGEALTKALDMLGIKYGQAGVRNVLYYIELRDRLATLLGRLSPSQRQAVDRLGFRYIGPGDDAFEDYRESVVAIQSGKP